MDDKFLQKRTMEYASNLFDGIITAQVIDDNLIDVRVGDRYYRLKASLEQFNQMFDLLAEDGHPRRLNDFIAENLIENLQEA